MAPKMLNMTPKTPQDGKPEQQTYEVDFASYFAILFAIRRVP